MRYIDTFQSFRLGSCLKGYLHFPAPWMKSFLLLLADVGFSSASGLGFKTVCTRLPDVAGSLGKGSQGETSLCFIHLIVRLFWGIPLVAGIRNVFRRSFSVCPCGCYASAALFELANPALPHLAEPKLPRLAWEKFSSVPGAALRAC